MKESNFYSDEFEQLIREKTEQYKMYPSENVWKGVHNSLHTKRKWFIGSMSLLVIGILFFSGKELLTPGHPLSHKLAGSGTLPADNVNADPSRSAQPEDNPHANFVRLHPVSPAAASGRRLNAAGNPGTEPEEADQPLNHLAITISHPVVSQPDLSELLSHAVQLPGQAPSLIGDEATTTVAMNKPVQNPQPGTGAGLLDSWLVRNAPENQPAHRAGDASAFRNNTETFRENAEAAHENADAPNSKEGGRGQEGDDAYVRNVIENLSARGQQRVRTSGEITRNAASPGSAVAGKIRESTGNAKASADEIGEASDLSRVNWLHDYAVYSLPPSSSKGRLYFQLVLAPTLNYRTLTGGMLASSKQLGGSAATIHAGDVQSWVDRTPAMGFEFGGSILYRVTRNLTVKGGLQFDYSRYRMLAYTNTQPPAQQQTSQYRTPLGNAIYMDSIAAQPPAVSQSPNISLSTVQATLYNDYYQLSAPLGFDLRVLGNERLQFNIGATLQPSYLINTDSYVLSSDYTNYSKQPSAFRRWNLTTGVEAFLSYQSGPIRWQIGPEFRYQLFSTYLSGAPYPISENLKGYGIRIGITKPFQ